jgi:AcrR family transcriptional regulator
MVTKSARRDLLVSTASELFYRRGFHATGIDTVLGESGVAKMTLYNHFKSKDGLIVATIQDRSLRVMKWIEFGTASRAQTAIGKLLVLFDIHEEWFNSPDFLGCYFQRACAEFPDSGSQPHRAAATHFSKLFDCLRNWAEEADLGTPAARAEEALLLLEGATALAQATGATIAARRARRAFEATLG